MTNIRDQMNFARHEEVQRCAFSVIDRLQEFPGGIQATGAAMVFLLLCKRFDEMPSEVLGKANAMLYDTLSFGKQEHANAIKAYLSKEL